MSNKGKVTHWRMNSSARGHKFMPHLMAYIVFTRFGVRGHSSPF